MITWEDLDSNFTQTCIHMDSVGIELEIILNQAKTVLGPVVDLGCGLGGVIDYLVKNGIDAYGIDFNKKVINLAKRNLESNAYRVAHGNFFPPNIKPIRNPNQEDMFAPMIERHQRKTKYCGWDHLPISINEVGLLYHFQVEQIDNLLALLQFTSPGCKLVVQRVLEDNFTLPNNIAYKKIASDFDLFTKKN